MIKRTNLRRVGNLNNVSSRRIKKAAKKVRVKKQEAGSAKRQSGKLFVSYISRLSKRIADRFVAQANFLTVKETGAFVYPSNQVMRQPFMRTLMLEFIAKNGKLKRDIDIFRDVFKNDIQVRKEALKTLVKAKDKASLPEILRVLRTDENYYSKLACAKALREIGMGEKHKIELRKILRDKSIRDPATKQMAELALAKDKKTFDKLLKELTSHEI